MHKTEIRVRWYDVDRENVVYFGNYFRFFRKQDQVLLADGKVRTACVSLGDEFKVVKMPEEVFERLSRASNTDDK